MNFTQLLFLLLFLPKMLFAQIFEVDTSFLPAWKSTLEYPNNPVSCVANIFIHPDGRILCAGGFNAGVLQGYPTGTYTYMVRLFPNGNIDPSFTNGSYGYVSAPF